MKKFIHGLILCLAIAVAALQLSPYLPLGAVTLSIILGIFIGNLFKPGDSFNSGISFAEKKILSFAIAFMGVNLDFTILKELGLKSLGFVILAMALTIGFSLIAARLLKIDKKFALLLGIGNGVCGSSAIAATKNIIGADKEDAALSIAIVNFLGTLGIFALPFISSVLMGLDDINTGFLIGNTLQAVGQVAAAGFSVSDVAGQTATVIKMSRILMLFPLIMILLIAFARTAKSTEREKNNRPAIPFFIIAFIMFSMIPTFGILPEDVIRIISKLSKYCLMIAMSAIGLKISVKNILNRGQSALLTGSLIFFVQILFNCAVVLILFRN